VPKKLNRGYIQSWNVMLQKELPWAFTGQIGYVATRSVRQLGYLDINASQAPFTNRDTQPLFQKWGRTAATTFMQPVGTGTYDSLQASLQRRFTKGLMMNLHYTWGKAINFQDSGNTTGFLPIQSQSYLRLNRAPPNYDRTHNLELASILELPVGRGKHWLSDQGVLTHIVSGWQLNNLVSVMSGAPFNVSGDCDAGWPGNSPSMVDIVGTPKKLGRTDAWYDPGAFAQVYDPSNPGTCLPRLGTSGFGNLRGPGIFNWDLGVFRDFAFTERIHMQFRLEAFNFTNTPHYDIPDNSIGDADSIDQATGRVIEQGSFMRITGVTNLAREEIDERQFRLGLRFQF
jgi:hypothetical protein